MNVDLWSLQKWRPPKTKTHEKLGVNTQKRVPENEDPWKCRPENEDLLSFFILQSTLDNPNLKLANSNLALTWTIKLISPGFPSYITEILPLVTKTLKNSNLPLTRSNFSPLQIISIKFYPWQLEPCFKLVRQVRQDRKKNSLLKSETWNLFPNIHVNSLSSAFS